MVVLEAGKVECAAQSKHCGAQFEAWKQIGDLETKSSGGLQNIEP